MNDKGKLRENVKDKVEGKWTTVKGKCEGKGRRGKGSGKEEGNGKDVAKEERAMPRGKDL